MNTCHITQKDLSPDTPKKHRPVIKLKRTLNYHRLMRRIKICLWIVIAGLAISGITAFPLQTELNWLTNNGNWLPVVAQHWLQTVYHAIVVSNAQYPFLSYGTDWLAFAHLMLALLFAGPLRDPVKNLWVIQFGMLACLCVFPLAFIAGAVRGIPWFWRFIDCSFGLLGIIPLFIAYANVKHLKYLDRNGL
ncbi:hypothetical protein [Mucilaginibacter segetis]|uniref:Uncharacterized protein n=1 Tax=Mucilaginibacter segetis TaxID=2793071 RepID=A0A934UP78_9SPHI|nr:hypothetical protein [Mucilaginibacter segetis]MBK0380707.1 hypothetical protein [Mucilaginibacter segetis]